MESNAKFELEPFLGQELSQHRQVLEATVTGLAAPFERILSLWESSIRGGGKLLLFGNGGSAADAQHIAAEMVIRYQKDRPPIAAIALTTDSSALTAGANDLGFDQVFSRQVAALGRPGDVVVGISTSGRSPNVVAGLRAARQAQLRTTGLLGGDGGEAHLLCDAVILVPSIITARIQEMHILIGHMLCRALEMRLGLAG